MNARDAEGRNPDLVRNSVIAAIERLIGVSSRVLLREEDKAPLPMLDLRSSEMASAPRRTGQYHVLGEIARGGVGVVLKGHDVDLGRDVAMKVLREEHTKNASIVQRFVEEAQIGGQLQHPGIVPVYEIGTREDGRPFFTMKLVKGKTLAVILLDRKERGGDLAADRRSLLAIFERVCQTIAYAHSRRVVHRDLKPANIMVGAFGEVLVVDWGLAKVLPRDGEKLPPAMTAHLSQISIIETVRNAPGTIGSDSLVGSVLGTPAYMAPEQAQGQVDRVDERADVFALGALLCEILTGEPPYTGAHDQLVARAASAELDEARARLDACGADPELIQLANKCLMPAIAARPQNAEAVSRAITNHLAAIDDRARVAQIESAAARVKAQEERRAKKLTFALAAAMVLIAGFGGGGWLVLAQQRAARVHEATTQAAATLDEAEKLLAQGDAAAALALAERTQASLADRAHEVDPAQHDALAGRSEDLVRRSRDVLDQQQLDRENRDFFAALDALRLPEEQNQIAVDWKAVDEQYSDVFRSFGLDPTVESESEADAAAALKRRGIDRELAACLDDWSRVLRRAKEMDTAARLTRLAAAIDPDPLRVRLRQAVLEGNRAELQEVSRDEQLLELPPATLNLFAVALSSGTVSANAMRVLRIGQRLHPDDFALTMNLAQKTYNAKDVAHPKQASARFYAAALALHPDSVEARVGLASSLIEFDLHNEYAAELMREAVRLRPDNTRVNFLLGFTLAKQGIVDEAIAAYRTTLKNPQYDFYSTYYAHNNLGLLLKRQGKPLEAIEEYRAAILIDENNSFAHSNLADVWVEQGDFANAGAELQTALRLAPNDASLHANAGRVFLRMGNDDDAILELTTALQLNPKEPYARVNRGICHMNMGDDELGIADFRAELANRPEDAFAHRMLAIALVNRGQLAEAITEMRAAVRHDPKDETARKYLDDWVRIQARRDETLAAARADVLREPDDPDHHVALGRALAASLDLDAAIEEFREALDLDPEDLDARRALGGVLYRQSRFEDALEEFRTVADSDTGLALDHDNVALILERLGRLDEAMVESLRAIELDANDVRAHAAIAQVHHQQGRVGLAIDELRIVLRLDPKDDDAANALAWYLATTEDAGLRNTADGVTIARGVADRTPDSSNAWNTLGVALYCDGQFEPAAEALQKSLELGPTIERPFDYLFLAMCAHQLGDPERARDWFDQMTAYQKRHPPADPPTANDLVFERFRAEAEQLLGNE